MVGRSVFSIENHSPGGPMPLTRSLHFFLAGACSRGLRSAVVALALTVSLLVVSSSLVLAQNLDASSVFVEAPPYPVGGNQATSVAVADLNGDGKPDLVVGTACCNQGNNGLGPNSQVSVLLGNGDGTFQPPVSYYPFGSIAVSVAVADVNGDGKPDLVVSNSGSTLVNDSIAVLLGNGDGTFQSPLFYLFLFGPESGNAGGGGCERGWQARHCDSKWRRRCPAGQWRWNVPARGDLQFRGGLHHAGGGGCEWRWQA